LSLPLGTFGGKKVRPRTTLRGNHIPVPVRDVPKVVLEESAMERVAQAVASGEIVNIDEKQMAPTKPVWDPWADQLVSPLHLPVRDNVEN
jgi:hypothetical protein